MGILQVSIILLIFHELTRMYKSPMYARDQGHYIIYTVNTYKYTHAHTIHTYINTQIEIDRQIDMHARASTHTNLSISRKMIQQPTWSSIWCMYRTQKPYTQTSTAHSHHQHCQTHTLPQASGNSLLTVVVLIEAKNAPRWTQRK